MRADPAGPLVLVLDTGSPVVSVAVGVGGSRQEADGVLAARSAAMERSSGQLLALVGAALAEAGARPRDLAGVVALAGPGSFTGLRIGLATALGLHQALRLPALALPTLWVLAAQVGAGAGEVVAAVDALRGQWSAQGFLRGPVPVPGAEMALVDAASLTAISAGETERVVIGFGVTRLAAGLGAPAGLRLVEPDPLAPTALRLAAGIPFARWEAASLASPIYSRPPAVTLPRRRGGASPVPPVAAP
jgi:tRNA threonylcarbamoyladenosine biosynthesis protein TsaB